MRLIEVVCAIFLIVIIICISIVTEDKTVVEKTVVVEKNIYKNNFGQCVETVIYGEFYEWLNTHKNKKIISICSIDNSEYGHVKEFLIVYDDNKQ